MQISQAHYDRIIAALSAKGAPKPCAVCGHPKFTLSPGLVYLILQFDQQPMLQNPNLPCAALSCDNCGNTILISLQVLGLGNLLASSGMISRLDYAGFLKTQKAIEKTKKG